MFGLSHATITLAPPLGLALFTLNHHVIYMTKRAEEICFGQRDDRDPAVQNEVPPDVQTFCDDVAQALRTNSRRWRDVHLYRLIESPTNVLLQGLGFPDTTGKNPGFIIMVLEQRTGRQFGMIKESQCRYHLTNREVTIMEYVIAGLTSKEIGGRLGISYETVNEHIKHVMEKTATNTRTAALGRLLGITAPLAESGALQKEHVLVGA